jgi:Dyp-type peroxidase family
MPSPSSPQPKKPLFALSAQPVASLAEAGAVPPEPEEELLAIDEIQGNIVPGFNKDHQLLIFLRITEPALAKRWLAHLTEHVARLSDVLPFNRLFRELRLRRGHEAAGLAATWVNVAFSFAGLRRLTPLADAFPQGAFRAGLAARSTLLGDPADPAHPGSAVNWKIGGPGTEADVLVIVASDRPRALVEEAAALFSKSAAASAWPPSSEALAACGLELLVVERGEILPNRGHEHFGFKDGISQPGVRGRMSSIPGDYLTPRTVREPESLRRIFGKPGQILIWPGDFIAGYLRQDDQDPAGSLPVLTPVPDWTRNGSFLVFRRLRQDVAAFRRFVAEGAAQLRQHPDFADVTNERFAAMLVGRWPSGAPASRTPDREDAQLGWDDLANNHFVFIGETPAVNAQGESGLRTIAGCPADAVGARCPLGAHVRKVNPRDVGSESGSSLTRRLLRRGIPYGPPLPPDTMEDDGIDRGLLFLAYTASIESTFELLQASWANRNDQPEVGGHDLIIGQNPQPAAQRRRTITFASENGALVALEVSGEWVIPTGGGYFFAPSISAIRDVLTSTER